MQAYAEGFDVFRNANSQELSESYRYDLNWQTLPKSGVEAVWWARGWIRSSRKPQRQLQAL